ncbi:MAG: biopolymer transporter ExbD [Pirellulales bacterium]|nr:biopolymer transporter ExbD [Pirellulales bacterium]MBX3435383.1 biopolymer transporter ExbD [Pirellulales bacterium]
MKIRHADRREHIVLQMTPMIDIVFQLLVFFVFTFKIVLPEGDFNIRMPAAAGESAQPSETPVIRVRLRAGENRELAGVELGDAAITGENPFGQLQARIRAMIDDSAGPGSTDQEVELDCDYDLKYRYVINAITAISGYFEPGQKEPIKLIERVRFAPTGK